MTDRSVRLAQVEADLADLDVQVAAGELDDETAGRLRETYERERLAILETPEGEPDESGTRHRGRVVVGTLLVLVAVAAAGIAVALSATDRGPGDLITGDVPGVDLASITNEDLEEVVADFPEIVGMRLALADRYFNDGDFSSALGHYLTVLDLEPANPRALASIGWMTYLSGEPEIGARYVEQALAVDDEFPQAHYFLGAIRLLGLGDAAGAIGPLERVLTFDGVPAEVRSQTEQLLAEARAAS